MVPVAGAAARQRALSQIHRLAISQQSSATLPTAVVGRRAALPVAPSLAGFGPVRWPPNTTVVFSFTIAGARGGSRHNS